MAQKDKSLLTQDTPDASPVTRKSHRFKIHWRRTVFHLTFRALEVLASLLQVIQFLCEIFRRNR